MERPGLRVGHLVALAGAAVVLVALWLPWFQVQLGPAERAELGRGAGALGAPFAAFADGLLSQLDGLELNAWKAFGGEDVALAGGAVLAILALLAVASPASAGQGIHIAPQSAGRLAQAIGLVLGLIVLVRMTDRPGPPGPQASSFRRDLVSSVPPPPKR